MAPSCHSGTGEASCGWRATCQSQTLAGTNLSLNNVQDVTKPLSWSPELSARLSLQHCVSRRKNTELSARLCVCIANGLLLGSLERGSRWMLWVFLARSIWAVLSCCRILLNLFQQSNGSGMLQGSGGKFFSSTLQPCSLSEWRAASFSGCCFAILNVFVFFPLEPQDKPWEALLTCCTGLR